MNLPPPNTETDSNRAACGAPAQPGTPPPWPQAPRLSSRELLGQGREVEIAHGDAVYRLRLTSQGKLILTK